MLPGLLAARVLWRNGKNAVQQPIRHRHPVSRYSNRITLSWYGSRHSRTSTTVTTKKRHKVQDDPDEDGVREKILLAVSAAAAADNAQWSPVYRFTGIRVAGTISRFKIIQTVIVTGMVPMFTILHRQNEVSLEAAVASVGIGFFALVMLYLISGILRHCIGVISISHDHKQIRIGYLNFWGWRRNITIPVDDIVPLQEANVSLDAKKLLPPYVHLKRYSDAKFRLYLPLRRVEIVDKDLFENVFGELPHTKKAK